MTQATATVLVIGGTGVFGRLIVADLLTHTPLRVAVAARRGIRASGWLPGSEGRVTSHRLDARREKEVRALIERTGARVVVHAAGPYARIGDAPLRAALAARVPYADMCPRSDLYAALRRRHDGPAREAGIPLLPGASTAGGLTGLLTRRAAARMRRVERVRVALRPQLRLGRRRRSGLPARGRVAAAGRARGRSPRARRFPRCRAAARLARRYARLRGGRAA